MTSEPSPTTPAIGFAGWSGAGKTTLIERLIPWLTARGRRVSIVKHAHHRFDLDRPGKDSWRHREAGATEVLISSAGRWALLHELRDAPEPRLADHLERLAPCDLVLVEGYRGAELPKIECWRRERGGPTLFATDPAVIAVATDAAPADVPGLADWIAAGRGRLLDIDDVDGIGRFVEQWVERGRARRPGRADDPVSDPESHLASDSAGDLASDPASGPASGRSADRASDPVRMPGVTDATLAGDLASAPSTGPGVNRPAAKDGRPD